jgi:hypothetical protein
MARWLLKKIINNYCFTSGKRVGAVLLLTFFVVALGPLSLGAQDKAYNKAKDKSSPRDGVEVKGRDDAKAKTSTGYYPELTFLFAYTLPMGSITDSLKAGFGGRMVFSVDTLSLLGLDLGVEGLNSRVGFNFGYHLMNQDTGEYSASLSLIPMFPTFELNYTFPVGIRLYTKAGYGFAFARTTKQYKVDTIDGKRVSTKKREAYALNQAIEYTIGAFYKHKGVPHVAYYLDVGYMMVMESTQAHFLHLTGGVSYHFYP